MLHSSKSDMRPYRIAYATGSRADYGIVRRYLSALQQDGEIALSLLVTGSHLERKYGYTVDAIRADGFDVALEVPLDLTSTDNVQVLDGMGRVMSAFGRHFERERYDLVILLGDRYEMMGVAIAAAMQRLPVLHLHGGEVTAGNYDEFIRHSISKMSSFHFTSTEEYRRRVIQLGEAPDRVFYMGALGAENCAFIDEARVEEAVKALPHKQYLVVAFHPETLTGADPLAQVRAVLEGLAEVQERYGLVFIGTNADTGSDAIREAVRAYVEAHPRAGYFESLDSDSYMYLLRHALCLVGNSSSGIIEAPSLSVYTVDVGDRQRGRVRAESVLHAPCKGEEIAKALAEVERRAREPFCAKNPYYLADTAQGYYQKTKEILKLKKGAVAKDFYDL